jgi:hypothetical protein
MYTNKNNERESDRKSHFSSYFSTRQRNAMKRLLVLLLMTISLAFAGARSTPIVKAGGGCEMVCTQYIDPSDGQCYIACCPADSDCKMPCERTSCQ